MNAPINEEHHIGTQWTTGVSQFKSSKFSVVLIFSKVVFWNFQKSENSHAIEGEDCSRLQVPNNGNFWFWLFLFLWSGRRDDQRLQTSSVSIHLLEKREWYASSNIPKPCHVNTCMSKCTVCNWSVGGTPTNADLLHNFSYACIARQLHNEACSCTQDRLEIIVDVQSYIGWFESTLLQ